MKIVTKINNHILNKRINIINNRITKHEIIGEINKINNKKNERMLLKKGHKFLKIIPSTFRRLFTEIK